MLKDTVELFINGESEHSTLEHYFALHLEELFKLFQRKNESYGTGNIAALGIRGVFVRLWDKLNRLKNLVWLGKTNPLSDESVWDTFCDIAVYAVIALLLIKELWPGLGKEEYTGLMTNKELILRIEAQSIYDTFESLNVVVLPDELTYYYEEVFLKARG